MTRHDSQRTGFAHAAIVLAFLGTMALVADLYFPRWRDGRRGCR